MNIKRTFSPWWLLAAIPLVALVLVFAGQYLRQVRVDREFRDQVTLIRKSGYPVDAESLLQHLRHTMNDENTVAWIEWMEAVFEIHQASLSAGVFDYENGDPVIVNASPDKPWPEDAVRDAFFKQSEPVYDRLKDLTRQDDDKVWLPLVLEANGSTLTPRGMVWAIRWFLLPWMMHAVHEHDAEAAMEAIATQNEAMNAFDWQTSMSSEIQRNAMLGQRNKIIIQAIDQDLFSAEQLSQLEQLVGQQPDIRERWRNVIAAERAIFLERVGDLSGQGLRRASPRQEVRSSNASIPASYVRQQLMNLDLAMSAADEGIGKLQQRATAAGRGLDTISQREQANGISRDWSEVLQGIVPNVAEFARSLVGREASRKKVIEAIDRARLAVVSQGNTPQPGENSPTK